MLSAARNIRATATDSPLAAIAPGAKFRPTGQLKRMAAELRGQIPLRPVRQSL
jgi:hypothetical protein